MKTLPDIKLINCVGVTSIQYLLQVFTSRITSYTGRT